MRVPPHPPLAAPGWWTTGTAHLQNNKGLARLDHDGRGGTSTSQNAGAAGSSESVEAAASGASAAPGSQQRAQPADPPMMTEGVQAAARRRSTTST